MSLDPGRVSGDSGSATHVTNVTGSVRPTKKPRLQTSVEKKLFQSQNRKIEILGLAGLVQTSFGMLPLFVIT